MAIKLTRGEAFVFYENVSKFFDSNHEGVMDLLSALYKLDPNGDVALWKHLDKLCRESEEKSLNTKDKDQNSLFNTLIRLQRSLSRKFGFMEFVFLVKRFSPDKPLRILMVNAHSNTQLDYWESENLGAINDFNICLFEGKSL